MFIVFEGVDGCGKTTQLEYLRQKLIENGKEVFVTYEPSDSIPGLICRGIIKNKISAQNETEALLFAADRYEHITAEILPQLQNGKCVLCDRFYLSNFAYQSHKTDMNTLLQYNMKSMKLIRPDITLFLDVSPLECKKRRNAGRTVTDRHDERTETVYRQYMAAIEFLKENVLILDGMGSCEEVAERIWSAVSGLL
jgi:dTMP kinase